MNISLLLKDLRLKKVLGYTNLDSEKGFLFFQKFLKESGILADLEKPESRKAIRSVCTDLILTITSKP